MIPGSEWTYAILSTRMNAGSMLEETDHGAILRSFTAAFLDAGKGLSGIIGGSQWAAGEIVPISHDVLRIGSLLTLTVLVRTFQPAMASSERPPEPPAGRRHLYSFFYTAGNLTRLVGEKDRAKTGERVLEILNPMSMALGQHLRQSRLSLLRPAPISHHFLRVGNTLLLSIVVGHDLG